MVAYSARLMLLVRVRPAVGIAQQCCPKGQPGRCAVALFVAMLRNWAGNLTYDAAEIHQPSSVVELQDLVARLPRVARWAQGTRSAPSLIRPVPWSRWPRWFRISASTAPP
jgi:hypothetical protein